MSMLIETNLHYLFVHEELLNSALKSAHREKNDDILDDGNRGLAHYGNLAIQMAMTYEAIIDRGKTLHDINAQAHWSKTKKGRAKACRLLGIDSLVMQSVRQQHQAPSDTVLDHALSAVIGAIWIDCERQEYKISEIRSTVLEVLRTIDAILDNYSTIADCVSGMDDSSNYQCNPDPGPVGDQSNTMELYHGDLDDAGNFIRDWFKELYDGSHSILLHQSDPLEAQSPGGQDGCTVSLDSHLKKDSNVSDIASSDSIPAFDGLCVAICADISQYDGQDNAIFHAQDEQGHLSTVQRTPTDSTTTVNATKRKRTQSGEERLSWMYDNMLQAEQQKLAQIPQIDQEILLQFLKHPSLDELKFRKSILARFVYLAIGSWETIVDFRNLLQVARGDSNGYRRLEISPCNVAAMYAEICRLEREEALSVLLRRYYILRLCEEEQLYNDRYDHIVVETPRTLEEGIVAKPGNPINALDSSFTDRFLLLIMPDIDARSNEFQKARFKVKRWRKLAARLRQLVKHYGVGVLGLLPSGPSFDQMPLTDSMLLAMPQASFDDFVRLLHQEQGLYLEGLSRILEPSLLALATGFVESDAMWSMEWINNPLLANAPKGLLRQYLMNLR